MKYEFGLRNCPDSPQEFKVSHILAGFMRGYKGKGEDGTAEFILTQVSVEDETVKSDGSLDINVPARLPDQTFFLKRWFRNMRLACKVLTGKADVLYRD